MIQVEHLSKSYGALRAVRDISFEVRKGAVVGVLGPNGAGKSTTLRILAGYLGASSGRVRIAGYDVESERLKAVRNIGYMPETSPLYPEMRVVEYLRFRAELKRLPRSKRHAEVERAIDEAKVGEVATRVIGQLSKGYRQRVGLADALLGSPPLLILDEPTSGLDPNQIQQVRALIRRLAQHHTILLSTHILSEVEATCDRAIVINRGRLVAEGAIEELRGERSAPRVELIVRAAGHEADVAALLGALGEVATVKEESLSGGDQRLLVSLASGADAGKTTEQMVACLCAAEVGVRKVAPLAASLEQIFSSLTADAQDGATDAEDGETS